MNPYYFEAKRIGTIEQAKYVLKLFDAEIKNNVAAQSQAGDRVQSQLDVLKQTHLGLANDLEALAYSAALVGTIEGERAALDRTKMQFFMALPYQLRKALEAETK